MFVPTPEVVLIKSENVPKLSFSRNRRLRKKLMLDEYAEHFIDIRFHIPEKLSDEELDMLMGVDCVTFFTMTNNTLFVSTKADTMKFEFDLALGGGKESIENACIKRASFVAEILGRMTGYHYQSRIASICFGDANYASMDYYWGEGEYETL